MNYHDVIDLARSLGLKGSAFSWGHVWWTTDETKARKLLEAGAEQHPQSPRRMSCGTVGYDLFVRKQDTSPLVVTAVTEDSITVERGEVAA